MPFPIIGYLLWGGGGLILGYLSRQPEINKLKRQIRNLLDANQRLRVVIDEQDRQIEEWKLRFSLTKGLLMLSSMKGRAKATGLIIQQYALREYIELAIAKVHGRNLSEEECAFLNTYAKGIDHVTRKELTTDDYLRIKGYLRSHYGEEIRTLQPIQEAEWNRLLRKSEECHV